MERALVSLETVVPKKKTRAFPLLRYQVANPRYPVQSDKRPDPDLLASSKVLHFLMRPKR